MHHVAHFFTDPSVWIGVRQLAVQRIGCSSLLLFSWGPPREPNALVLCRFRGRHRARRGVTSLMRGWLLEARMSSSSDSGSAGA
jgi:hypothetical protein